MSDTELQQLIIYVGTTAQIEAAIQAGTITENDLSISTDAPDFQEKLTDVQMNAVNSGITTQLVSLYSGHVANTTIHVTEQNKTTWNNKQDTISDLITIRSNAQAGKSASDTISGYGNIVTHNVNEFATSAQGAKADSAVQSVTTGNTNGTLRVDGTEVPVKGLGSAAYTPSTNYATSQQGTKADSALQAGDDVSELNNDAGYITYSATFYWGE